MYNGFVLKDFEKRLACIPKGSFNWGTPGDNDPYAGDSIFSRRTIDLDSFYISKFEVCNGQYLEYVTSLLRDARSEDYLKALPDTLVWRNRLAYNEPYVDYYFRHPAYRDYPVVGITYDQANNFCVWLTDKYMREEKRKYKKIVFKLPTRWQWYYAARGKEDRPFPWNGPYMRRPTGEFCANFSRIAEQNIYRDQKTKELKVIPGYPIYSPFGGYMNDAADITAPVLSYWPNDFGIYNMAGNVEEFVREKGKKKGGSWYDPGYYLQNFVEESYLPDSSASSERGFRFVMEILK